MDDRLTVVEVLEERPAPRRAGASSRRRRSRPTRERTRLALPRVDGLDGLRVLGALAVVVYHVMGAILGPNPGAGVIMPPAAFTFFIISGFVIYRPFVAAHVSRGKMPRIGRYLASRSIRVLPLWWVAVAVYLLVDGTGQLDTPLEWVATLTLLQFLVPDVRFAVIGPAWALSVEWIFYLTVPFLALGLRTLNARLWRGVDPVAVQVAALVPLLAVCAVVAPARPFVGILIGMLLAVADVQRHLRRTNPNWLVVLRSPATALVATAVAWVVLLDYPYKEGLSVQWVEQDPLVVAIWVSVATVWFAPVAFRPPTGLITRRLASPWMIRLSVLTFGLYLWHDLVLQQVLERMGTDAHLGAALYLTLLGAFALAATTFVLIERPLMAVRNRLVPPSATVAARPDGTRASAEALEPSRPEESSNEVDDRRARPRVSAMATSTSTSAASTAARLADDAPEAPEAAAATSAAARPDATEAPAAKVAPGRGWITSIDGLRVVAALCVITFHVCAEERVPAGVAQAMAALMIPVWSVFFVVSGYVLYRPWTMAQARMALGDGTPPARAPDGGAWNFYLRRLLRVYPVYWVVQATALAISGTEGIDTPMDWFQVITLFPLPNFDIIIHHGLGVIVWTMVVELAYYAVLPWYSRAVTSSIARGRSYVAANAVWLAVGFAVLAVVASTGARILAVACCILVGMGIAALDAWQRATRTWAPGIRRLARQPILALPVVLVWWAIGTYVARDDNPDLLFENYLAVHLAAMVCVSFVLFIPAVFGPAKGGYRRFLGSRFMRVFGPLTFGIYLWHYPVIRQTVERVELPLFALWAWVLVAAPAMAFVTYRLIEQPAERFRHAHLGRTSSNPPPAPGAGSHQHRSPA